jgi:UDP-N-acetylglucosamine:LPS N-acetylglucosamine transferase
VNNPITKVLAVASGGGHWEQLMLLRSTLERYHVRYATTHPDVARQHGVPETDTLPDCNQNAPLRSLLCAIKAIVLVARERPDVIVSTGSAPGFFCLLAGRLLGARTLWIDSVANADELSMSGHLSRRVAHECWTQWEHLARPGGPAYHGAVL